MCDERDVGACRSPTLRETMKTALLAAIALLALVSLAAAVDPLKKDWSKLSEKNLEESASRVLSANLNLGDNVVLSPM